MEIEEKELMEMRERNLKEVCAHIDCLIMRINVEQSRLNKYLDEHYSGWVALINETQYSLKSKGMTPSLPAFTIEFANERLAFLDQKKAYIEECLALVNKIDSEKESADIEKLAEMDAILASIANSLGFFYGDECFTERWDTEDRMRFIPHSSSTPDLASEALVFLRDAYKKGRLTEIENMEDVFDALDVSEELEYTHSKLKEYNLDY